MTIDAPSILSAREFGIWYVCGKHRMSNRRGIDHLCDVVWNRRFLVRYVSNQFGVLCPSNSPGGIDLGLDLVYCLDLIPLLSWSIEESPLCLSDRSADCLAGGRN